MSKQSPAGLAPTGLLDSSERHTFEDAGNRLQCFRTLWQRYLAESGHLHETELDCSVE